MTYLKTVTVVATALAMLFAGQAIAAQYAVTLTNVWAGNNNGTSSPGILSGDLTGTYDDSTGIVTMDGTMMSLFQISPVNTIFTDVHTDWSTGNFIYSAAAYSCAEGTFGVDLSAHFCGAWDFGMNFINESSTNYTTIPGTRIIGGDDQILTSPMRQGALYATNEAFFDGSNLIMNSADWNGGTGSDSTDGIQLRFNAVLIALPGVGGSAVGLSLKKVVCKNKTTGLKVTITINGAATDWNCEAGGLVINTGDKVVMRAVGFAE